MVDRTADDNGLPAGVEVIDDVTAMPEPEAVIVGFDGSPSARAALEWARRWAPDSATIVAAVAPDEGRHGFRGRSAAGQHLVDWSSAARLLVVGSRGRGRWTGAALGSVSAHCAHHSVVPVAIVPGGTAAPGSTAAATEVSSVAVGVDGSANSIEALRWALRSAPPGAVVDICFTWLSAPVASSLTAEEKDRVRASSTSYVEGLVDDVLAQERAGDRLIRRHMGVGNPADVLLASEPDVVVTGARSQSRWMSLLVDSPADALLGEAHAVVVVVPSGSIEPLRKG